jgi:sigma-B regulation protein RsbU (phosphoserine phosphatase)
MRRPRWQHALLAVFVIGAAVLQIRSDLDRFRDLLGGEPRARAPFTVRNGPDGRPVIASVQPEGTTAGIAPEQVAVSIDGVPFDSAAVLARRLREARPGEALHVALGDGAASTIVLQPRDPASTRWGNTAIVVAMQTVMPWLCLALGCWAVAVRPTDPLAWLLLMLLVSFSHFTQDPIASWENPMRLIRNVWLAAMRWSWAVWMMLFGVYFPSRLEWERRHGWFKWLLLGPLLLIASLATVQEVALSQSFVVAAALWRSMAPLAMPGRILQMAAIGVFFMLLGIRTGVTASPDARRRLQLLNAGAMLSLTPAFIAALAGLARRRAPMDAVPEWLVVPILLMMMLFPLTLAYVIVVHRAMDVRVVIRQGVRYAFARGGLMALRVIISAAVILGVAALASRPAMRRVDIVTVIAAGIALVFAVGLLGEKLIRWTDRRFFRDALNAETILSQLGDRVRTIVEVPALLETVARALSESLHVPRVVFLMKSFEADRETYAPALALGLDVRPSASLQPGSGVMTRLAAERLPQRVYLDDPSSWAAAGRLAEDERRMLSDLETQLLIPLLAGDVLTGVISLGPRRAEAPYSGSDLKLLRSLATQTALALENCRLTAAVADEVARRERLHREVEIAREVQERLFPQRLPPVAGLDYAGACRPALAVGGDYYDFLALPGGHLGIAIADVSGKGIGAALLMASLQASLRGQTLRQADTIGRVMDNVNQLVLDASPDNRYATFFYGQYDPAARRLTYVNAGHCAPLVLRPASGEILRLKACGTVVGLFPTACYSEATVTLQAGDLLVAYTDGISEAMNGEEEEWGEQRLIEAASHCNGNGAAARDILASLMSAADRFAAGAPQHDDMTLVVARIT